MVQEQSLGMADAVLKTKDSVAAHTPLLIVIADDVSDVSLYTDLLKTVEKSQAFGVMPGWKADRYYDFGYLVLDDDRVTAIKENQAREMNQVHMYILVVNISLTVPYYLRNLKKPKAKMMMCLKRHSQV